MRCVYLHGYSLHYLHFSHITCACTGMYGHVRACTGMYGHVRTCAGMYVPCTGMYGHVRAFTGMHGHVQTCTGMYGHVRACAGMHGHVRACAGMHGHVRTCTVIGSAAPHVGTSGVVFFTCTPFRYAVLSTTMQPQLHTVAYTVTDRYLHSRRLILTQSTPDNYTVTV